MKLFRLLKYDLTNGTIKRKICWILPICIYILLSLDLVISHIVKMNTVNLTKISAGDLFVYIFGGVKRYIPSPDDAFILPVVWTISSLSSSIQCIFYPIQDMSGYGMKTIVNSKKRIYWWSSKFIWLIFQTFFHYFLAYFVITFIVCLISGNVDFKLDSILFQNTFYIDLKSKYALKDSLEKFLLIPILVSCTINSIQLTLSLWIRPLFSFLLNSSYHILSAYFFTPFLLGNFSMLVRTREFTDGGLDSNIGIFLCFITIIIFFIVGAWRFKKYNILS